VDFGNIFQATAAAPVSIGNYCSIAAGVLFIAAGEHPMTLVSSYPFPDSGRFGPPTRDIAKGPITVGNDVWIGSRAIILSGVKIGDGAVVGAGSVVSKNVEPYAVVAGNPAKLIRHRFEPKVIEELLAIRWWDWSDNQIEAAMPDFHASVTEFVSKYQTAEQSKAPGDTR